jgi:nickel-dependent lactate racemase
MRVAVNYGMKQVELEADESRIVRGARPSDRGVSDPAAAVREALEAPYEYPPLRRALTPDDHLTIVVDEQLPSLGQLLVPILEHVTRAGVTAEAITLLVPPSTTGQPWVDDLPDEYQEARVEIHDPNERKRLRYLATTRGGRRLYLNQHVVDADQLVVLSGRRYDPVLGHGGAEAAIFPTFSDVDTRSALYQTGHLHMPGTKPWPIMVEALEAAWLLGAPFFVQVIPASCDGVADVVAGSTAASGEGWQRFESRWLQRISAAADVVVAGVSGDPSRHTIADLAAAAACAAGVVRPGGRIVLLSEVDIEPGPAFEILRGADDLTEIASRLGQTPAPEQLPVARWASAASHARLSLVSKLDADLVEEMSATPLESALQTQRLLDAGGTCLFLDDAHKARAILTDD